LGEKGGAELGRELLRGKIGWQRRSVNSLGERGKVESLLSSLSLLIVSKKFVVFVT
jgi:hypothetical protein